jgi:putative transposase
MTGIGPVAGRQPRVRDPEADAADPDRIRPATSPGRWRRCSARMLPGCRHQLSTA